MTLEMIKKMVHDLVSAGKTPKTLLLTVEDAEKLNLPTWTRQFLGMRVVIASNWPHSQVVPYVYERVTMGKTDEKALREYQEHQASKLIL